jgi:magnesium-transporting ATPase (P-type)
MYMDEKPEQTAERELKERMINLIGMYVLMFFIYLLVLSIRNEQTKKFVSHNFLSIIGTIMAILIIFIILNVSFPSFFNRLLDRMISHEQLLKKLRNISNNSLRMGIFFTIIGTFVLIDITKLSAKYLWMEPISHIILPMGLGFLVFSIHLKRNIKTTFSNYKKDNLSKENKQKK